MDDARITDGELVGRIVAGGEDEAFHELVKRHGAMVLRTCRRVTLNLHDAEDAAQMVFATLCARAEELRSYRSLAGWLYNTAWHVGRRVCRSQATRRRYESRAARDCAGVADLNGHADPEMVSELYRAIDMLPAEYCEAIVLHHLQGMTVKEVSALMDCAPGTTAARLSRGRAIIRERLAGRGFDVSVALLEATFLAEALQADALQKDVTFRLPSAESVAAASKATAAATEDANCGLSLAVAAPARVGTVVAANMLLGTRGWVAAACFAGVVTGGGSAGAYQAWLNRPPAAAVARLTASASAESKSDHSAYQSPPSSGSRTRGSVPEPSCLSLLALGVAALRRRRRRGD